MYHYTYLLTNLTDGRHYIGVRSSKKPPKEDPYKSSSTKVSKQYLDNCRKSIIQVFNSRKEAVINEIFWHNLLDVGKNPIYFNGAKQTAAGFDMSGIKKSKESSDKRVETIRKLRLMGIPQKKRKKCSDATKRKMSKTHKELASADNYTNSFKGKHHSKKSKNLISISNKKAWINNKTKARTFKPWFIHDLVHNTYTEFTKITKTDYAISNGYRPRTILDASERSKGVKIIKCIISEKCIIGNIP